jgi:hypothetical protein
MTLQKSSNEVNSRMPFHARRRRRGEKKIELPQRIHLTHVVFATRVISKVKVCHAREFVGFRRWIWARGPKATGVK